MNVMAYDLHGDWDNYTGHPSQLYAREEEYGPVAEINVVRDENTSFNLLKYQTLH